MIVDTLKDCAAVSKAKELFAYALELRHKIHMNPELPMMEFDTTALVRSELERMGVEIQELGLSTGCVALIHGNKPGNGGVIGLRADMDALPMNDECGQPWASRNPGIAHTCGHDSHTACLLAAAKGLMDMRDLFSGTVKLLFQPAEENFCGAKHIIEHGGMENPRIECLVGLHGTPAYRLGTYAIASGKIMASADEYTAIFHGKSAHGSRPVEGRNALLAAAHAVIGLQEIISNEVPTKEEAVVSTSILHAGTANNIIPDVATLSGTVRALDPDVRNTLEAAIKRICSAAAAICGCTVDVDYVRGSSVVMNNEELTGLVKNTAAKLVGEENVVQLNPLLGGEDFSFYADLVDKAVFYRFGTGVTSTEKLPQLHNSHYDTPDDSIPYVIAAHLQYILDMNG